MMAWLFTAYLACSSLPTNDTPKVDNAPGDDACADDWHGWLLLDRAEQRVAFLAMQDDTALPTSAGVIVRAIESDDGKFAGFQVPYGSVFDHLMLIADEEGGDYLYGVVRGYGECALSVDADPMLNAQGQPRFEQFANLTGQLYRLTIKPGTELTAIRSCTP